MVAGTDLVVDTVTRAHDALAALELGGDLGPNTTLAGELALAIGDNFRDISTAVSTLVLVSDPGDVKTQVDRLSAARCVARAATLSPT